MEVAEWVGVDLMRNWSSFHRFASLEVVVVEAILHHLQVDPFLGLTGDHFAKVDELDAVSFGNIDYLHDKMEYIYKNKFCDNDLYNEENIFTKK